LNAALEAHEITIRKATAPKTLRITGEDGKTHIDVYIIPKGDGKSQVSRLQHTKLANAREAARMKNALDRRAEAARGGAGRMRRPGAR
jgi:hypothetical protein